MLKRLYINNYALIDSLDIDFPENLVIITGETGAGKSILLGALSLLLGGRADVAHLGNKERNCVVEAEFSSNGDEYIVRRVLSPQGRSRAFINDDPVTLDELKELTSTLVDIHSQHQQQLLSDRRFHLSVIDAFAGNADLLKSFSEHYSTYQNLKKKIEELDARIEKSRKNRDYIEFQFNQLSEARLVPGELEELESEQSRLANSELIREQMARIDEIFESEEQSLPSQLRQLESALDRASAFVPELNALKDRVESARIELKDINYEISSIGEGISSDPVRLETVESRIALIYDLMRKHSADSVDELVSIRDAFSAELEEGVDFDNERSRLASDLDGVISLCDAEASALHEARLKAAPEISARIEASVRSLEMPHAAFRTVISDKAKWGCDGRDDVVFFFSANGEERLQELSKCASGGEMSRIMLCIKDLMSQYAGMPTIIFDEIDTGVSGSIAHKMGEMIVDMGRNMQVIAITHLPQVASKGGAHYIVEKNYGEDGRARSGIRPIEGEERVGEIARMLSGSSLTPEALANARVLLNEK